MSEEELISSIYEAAALPELWPEALRRLGRRVNSYGQAIVAIDRTGTTRYLASPEYEAAQHAFASARYPNIRPERAIVRRSFGFTADIELCTIEELEADPIYVKCLRPNGVMWTVGSIIPSPSSDIAYFDLCRGLGQEPFSKEDMALLNGFRPHLARAALLSTRLGLQRAHAAVTTLSVLGLPGAVLSRSMRVVAANDEFVGLAPSVGIGAGDHLFLQQKDPEARLRAILNRPESVAEQSGSIPVRPMQSEPALILHLLPIRGSMHDVFSAGTHLMVVTPVVAPQAPLTSLIAGLFDLTPAEARLARELANGETVRSFAVKAAISQETVRTHLKHIMQKTGTRRQTELVKLLVVAGQQFGRGDQTV
jgi:DNA-binding CsgD family transcriptional regulator